MIRLMLLALMAVPALTAREAEAATHYEITARGSCAVATDFDDTNPQNRDCAASLSFTAGNGDFGTTFNPASIAYAFRLDGIGDFTATIRHSGAQAYYWYDDGRPHCEWDACGFVELNADGSLNYVSAAAVEGIAPSAFGLEYQADGKGKVLTPDAVATANDWPTFWNMPRELFYQGSGAGAEYWLGDMTNISWKVSVNNVPPAVPLPASGLLLGGVVLAGAALRRHRR